MKVYCNLHLCSFDINTTEEAYKSRCDNPPSSEPLNLTEAEYTFEYDYPLENTAKFTRKLTPTMSALDLLAFGKEDYQHIYKEEDAASNIPPGNIPGMLNRNSTDGPYGIWGHDIGDLYFEGIEINIKQKKVKFWIGS